MKNRVSTDGANIEKPYEEKEFLSQKIVDIEIDIR